MNSEATVELSESLVKYPMKRIQSFKVILQNPGGWSILLSWDIKELLRFDKHDWHCWARSVEAWADEDFRVAMEEDSLLQGAYMVITRSDDEKE